MSAESTPLTSESVAASTSTGLKIEGITEQVVIRYFETLNAGDFNAASALFAVDGAMHPPFESVIVGRKAIAVYLQHEAQGMRLEPQQGLTQSLDNEQIQIQVAGKVQTSWCGVNVSWLFVLSHEHEILAAIKLLASSQELLSMQKG